MAEVYLQGADEVARAGRRMAEAAHDIQRAVSSFDTALERHRQFLDEWLQRFEAAVDKMKPEAL